VTFPAARNNDLVAELMQRFSQSASNARTAASDENSVPAELHKYAF
jgi:hypothetical protein